MTSLSPILKQATPQAAISQGLLTLTCGPEGNVVRLIPALVITEAEVATGLERFEAAVGAVVSAPAEVGA